MARPPDDTIRTLLMLHGHDVFKTRDSRNFWFNKAIYYGPTIATEAYQRKYPDNRLYRNIVCDLDTAWLLLCADHPDIDT